MPKISLASQFEMLRAQLESMLPTHSSFVVSSAQSGDGKHLAARGLADSFQAAGYETLLVRADDAGSPVVGAVAPDTLAQIVEGGVRRYAFKTSDGSPDCLVLSGDALRRGASHESVEMVCGAFRSRYRYTIIEAATIPEDNLALLFAKAVDGVLLTVREGRRIASADRDLASMLKRSDVRLLGVVSISTATIRADAAVVAKQTASYRTPVDAHFENSQQTERQPV